MVLWASPKYGQVLLYPPSLRNYWTTSAYPWQEKWKLPGTRSISNHPLIRHPLLALKSFWIRRFFSSRSSVSIYILPLGISYFNIVLPTFTSCTFRIFSMSRLSMEQGYFGKLISMFTLSFWSKCSWSMIKSLPSLGLKWPSTVTVISMANTPMETTEMQAPDTVPSLS